MCAGPAQRSDSVIPRNLRMDERGGASDRTARMQIGGFHTWHPQRFLIFYPSPLSHTKFTQPRSCCLLFGVPPPPSSVDVIYGSPLSVRRQPDDICSDIDCLKKRLWELKRANRETKDKGVHNILEGLQQQKAIWSLGQLVAEIVTQKPLEILPVSDFLSYPSWGLSGISEFWSCMSRTKLEMMTNITVPSAIENAYKMCLKSPGTDVGAAGFERVSQDFWDTFYLWI